MNYLYVKIALVLCIPTFVHADSPIFQNGITTLPGTTEPLQYVRSFLFQNKPLLLASTKNNENKMISHILKYDNEQWEIVLDGRTAMRDGSPVSINIDKLYNDERILFTLHEIDTPLDAAVAKYDGNKVEFIIQSIAEQFDNTNYSFYINDISFSDDTKTAVLAVTIDQSGGNLYYNNTSNEIYIYKNGNISELFKVKDQIMPGTNSYFDAILNHFFMAPDGSRFYFIGNGPNSSETRTYFGGYYYWEDSSLHKVLDDNDIFFHPSNSYATLWYNREILLDNNGTLYFITGTDIYPNSFGIRIPAMYKFNQNNTLELIRKSEFIFDQNIKLGINFQNYYNSGGMRSRINTKGKIAYTTGFRELGDHKLFIMDGDIEYLIDESKNEINIIGFNDNVIIYTIWDKFFRLNLTENLSDLNITINKKSFTQYIDYFFDVTSTANFVLYKDYDSNLFLIDIEKKLTEEKLNNFFYSFLKTDSDIHFVHGYQWIYAPRGYWPFVYSFSANQWLYLHGDWGYPLVAYAFGTGWIYSEAEIWPNYFNFEQESWASF